MKGENIIFEGDLNVAGNIEVHGKLIVNGDVHERPKTDEPGAEKNLIISKDACVLVCGDVTAKNINADKCGCLMLAGGLPDDEFIKEYSK